MRLLLILLLTAVLGVARAQSPAAGGDAAAAPAGLDEPPLLDPPGPEEARHRTEDIATTLRCPVCQGESVAASSSEAARDMYERIAELVALGYSKDQIVGYFVDRYGDWITLEPPAEGLNWVIWLGPVMLVVVGAFVIARQVGGQGEAAPSPLPAPAASATLPPGGGASPPGRRPAADQDDYRARILAELGEEEGR